MIYRGKTQNIRELNRTLESHNTKIQSFERKIEQKNLAKAEARELIQILNKEEARLRAQADCARNQKEAYM